MARQTKAEILKKISLKIIMKLLATKMEPKGNQKLQEESLLMKKRDRGMMTKGQIEIHMMASMHHHRERGWFLEGRSLGSKKKNMMMIWRRWKKQMMAK